MKKILLLTGALFCSLMMQAQNNWPGMSLATTKKKKVTTLTPQERIEQLKSGKFTKPIVNNKDNNWAQRPTALKKRLIGRSLYEMGEMMDTLYLTYSGTRTSKFRNCYENIVPEEFMFNPLTILEDPINLYNATDTSYDVLVKADTIVHLYSWDGGFEPDFAQAQQFDSATNRLKYFSQGEDFANMTTVCDSFKFNNNGKLTSFNFTEDALFETRIYKNYNSLGKKTADSMVVFYNGAWTPYSSVRYIYNTANNLTAIEQWVVTDPTLPPAQAWLLIAKGEMTNNNQGLVDTIRYFELDFNTMTLVPNVDGKKTYRTYDASGRLVSNADLYYDSSFGDYGYKDSFAYVGNNNLYAYNGMLYWNTDSARWDLETELRAQFNAAGNWDTIYINEVWWTDTLEPVGMITLTYNTDNLVENYKMHEWDGTTYGTIPTTTGNLYYETFDDGAVSIDNTNKVLVPFKLYPNPTSNIINISGLEQKVNLSLYNVDGRRIMHKENATSINLEQLASGSYWLRVTNQNNEVIGTQQVIKK